MQGAKTGKDEPPPLRHSRARVAISHANGPDEGGSVHRVLPMVACAMSGAVVGFLSAGELALALSVGAAVLVGCGLGWTARGLGK